MQTTEALAGHRPSTIAQRVLASVAWRIHEPSVQQTIISLLALGGLCLFFSLKTDKFLTNLNLQDLGEQISVVVVIGSAFTLLMVSGQFDLSVGGVVGLSGVVAALLSQGGHSLWFSFTVATLVGLGVGLLNGFLVIFMGIVSVIATIGTMYMCRGAADLLTSGVPVYRVPLSFSTLGNGYTLGVANPIPVMFLFVIVFTMIQRWTRLGRYAVATGSNRNAAFLAGVTVRRTQYVCFALCGAAAGWGGVMEASNLGSGLPTTGIGLEFEVIVAVVVGGASLFGGEGQVTGTFLGALIVGVVNNGLDLIGVSTYWQEIALGIVLICAVALHSALSSDRIAATQRALARVVRRSQLHNPTPPPAE
jgi:ribose/xylose/arabinose/galactoside ABC-type transport system permease subunit